MVLSHHHIKFIMINYHILCKITRFIHLTIVGHIGYSLVVCFLLFQWVILCISLWAHLGKIFGFSIFIKYFWHNADLNAAVRAICTPMLIAAKRTMWSISDACQEYGTYRGHGTHLSIYQPFWKDRLITEISRFPILATIANCSCLC